MNILSFIASVVFAGYFFLGLSVLFVDHRSRLNRLFFFMSIMLMVWSFSAAFVYGARTLDELRFWYRIAIVGLLPYFPMVLHFCLLFTRHKAADSLLVVLLYLPLPFFLWMGASGTLYHGTFYRDAGDWIFVPAFGSRNFILYVVYYCFCFVSSAALLALHIAKAPLKNERAQSVILLVSLALASILSAAEEAILPSLSGYRSRGLSPLLNVVLPLGVWSAISFFRLMRVPYLQLLEQVFSRVGNGLFILDRNGMIVSANASAERLLGLRRNDTDRLFPALLKTPSDAARAMGFLENERTAQRLSFTAELSAAERQEDGILELRLELLRDENGDSLGFFGSVEISGEEFSLVREYGLSERENEVAGYLLDGRSNRDIARLLDVTERTVKAHVSSIFRKLSVENRVGFLTLIRDLKRERKKGKTVPGYNTQS